MRNNPVASFLEFLHDVVFSADAPRLCQWRNAVVPLKTLADFQYASPLLQESHHKAKKTNAFLEPYSIELRDRTLISFLLVKGAKLNMAEVDIGRKAEAIAMKLTSYMSIGEGSQHSFGIHFLNDPTTAKTSYNQKVAPMKASARAMGGNADSYFEDLSTRLAADATEEFCLLVVRTHLNGLRKDEIDAAEKEYLDVVRRVSSHPASHGLHAAPLAIETEYGQALLPRARALVSRHESLATKICEDFATPAVGINTVLLGAREALDTVMAFGDREHIRGEWLPTVVGAPGSLVHGNVFAPSPSIAPLKLGIQILRKKIRGYVEGSDEVAQMGGTFYGTAMLELAPLSPEDAQSLVTFDALMRRIRSTNIPISVNFNLLPKGLKYNAMSRTVNGLLGSLSANNRQLRDALDTLRVYEEKSNGIDTVVGWQAMFSTWADSRDEAEKRLRTLKLTLSSWGSAQPITETGAPDSLKLDTIPEYTVGKHAAMLPAPLSHVLYSSPLMRPSSPWETGPLLFKTMDGVLYPVAIGSSLQNSYVTGIAAPSGSGKSYLLNRIHACMCLAPGQVKLPYLCLIDVGFGGEGYQRLLRTILPKEMHNQMQYFKVVNDAKYCVNPFDVQLGCHHPMSMELEFIKAVMALVLDGLGEETDRLASTIIQAAYDFFAPDSTTAKKWQSSHHEMVDARLREMNVNAEGLTAYEVRDKLFKAGFVREATIAQRYASPTLQDLTSVLNEPRITSMYASARTSTQEPLLSAAARAISQACADFAVISGVTRQDLDSARCIIINLQNVTSVTTDSGIRFAGMMYLYARHLGARHFFIDREEIELFVAPDFKEYQMQRVSEIQSSVKILSYDEWHNVKRLQGLVSLNVKEARETRKFRVFLNFITQYVTDYPTEILDGLTSLLVVGQQSENQNEDTRARLKLSDTDYNCLSNSLNALGIMWCYFKLRGGIVTTVLKNDVGPLEGWCYTTGDRDAPLRLALIDRMGESEALTFLAKQFPSGSASSYLERLANQRGNMSGTSAEAKSLTEFAVERLLADVHGSGEVSRRFG